MKERGRNTHTGKEREREKERERGLIHHVKYDVMSTMNYVWLCYTHI